MARTEDIPQLAGRAFAAARFFLEHYLSLRRMNSRRKVAGLWDGISKGILTVEEVVAIEAHPKIQRKEFPVVSIKIRPADGERDTLVGR